LVQKPQLGHRARQLASRGGPVKAPDRGLCPAEPRWAIGLSAPPRLRALSGAHAPSLALGAGLGRRDMVRARSGAVRREGRPRQALTSKAWTSLLTSSHTPWCAPFAPFAMATQASRLDDSTTCSRRCSRRWMRRPFFWHCPCLCAGHLSCSRVVPVCAVDLSLHRARAFQILVPDQD
jgi:hypothetical protein